MKIIRYILFTFILITAVQHVSSQTRIKYTINSGWKFHKGDIEKVADSDSDWTTVNIPHTWNARDVLDDKPGYYRGIAWYSKTFRPGPRLKNKDVYLYFEGANQDAEVFVNGQKAGSHLGGYTAFSIHITPYLNFEEDNIIRVKLSNAHNEAVPPLGGDLCHFGGIYRDVWIMAVNPVHFDMDYLASPGIFIRTPDVSEDKGPVTIESRINNAGTKSQKLQLTHIISDKDGHVAGEIGTKLVINPGKTSILKSDAIVINDPRLWSPDDPALYSVRSILKDKKTGQVLDEVSNTFGFRWFRITADSGFFLNGKHTFIRGIGKHQDYKDMGYAVPNELIIKDINMIKDMGCNLVRSHYPLDPMAWDACDRLGLMEVGRIPILDRIAFTREFTDNTKHMMKEMIMQNFNRPSVIIWEYYNEVLGDMDWYWPKPQDSSKVAETLKKTKESSDELEQFVRETDPSRLTEFVFHTDPTPQWYKEAGLTHLSYINGWNIYQGWYHNSLANVGPAIDTFRLWEPEMPYIITEFGAGSDPRIHTYQPTIFDFSTEYQEKFHKVYLDEVQKRPWIAGMCIWTFSDFQVDTRNDAVPHINSKGLVTTDRKPKDSYFLYKAYWSDDPFVHIASSFWTERQEIESSPTARREIGVYSNQDHVELFLNGQSLGVKKTRGHEATWTVPFTSGNNELQARAIAGSKDVFDNKVITFDFIPGDLKFYDFTNGLNINAGQSRTYFTDDITHTSWLPDKGYTERSYGHLGGRYYTHWTGMKAWEGIREGVGNSITGTDLDPVYQTFLVNPGEYRVSAPNGHYEVSLYFTEPFDESKRQNPDEKTEADANGKRIFNVLINGQVVIDHLDLARQFGVDTSVERTFRIEVSNGSGIIIGFEPVSGQPVISGIGIRRTDR